MELGLSEILKTPCTHVLEEMRQLPVGGQHVVLNDDRAFLAEFFSETEHWQQIQDWDYRTKSSEYIETENLFLIF